MFSNSGSVVRSSKVCKKSSPLRVVALNRSIDYLQLKRKTITVFLFRVGNSEFLPLQNLKYQSAWRQKNHLEGSTELIVCRAQKSTVPVYQVSRFLQKYSWDLECLAKWDRGLRFSANHKITTSKSLFCHCSAWWFKFQYGKKHKYTSLSPLAFSFNHES